ncbi:MAG: hypothetical protein WBG38_05230 [Nodosilinea sp.]
MTTRADHAAFGFAQTKYDDDGTPTADLSRPGLTKREYFAAMAMQGLLASGADLNSSALACDAVEHADKLVKYLND